MKKFVIGDIHGAYKALIQVLKLSKFDYENDLLICLGDVADSWPEVPECFDELLKIKNLKYVMGNHDYWLYEWLKFGFTPHIWTSQGGKATIDAYTRILNKGDTKSSIKHEKLLVESKYYHIEDNKLFVHGGYNWFRPIEKQDSHELMWDRQLWTIANIWERRNKSYKIKEFNEIFIGHSSTCYAFPDMKPVHVSNVWNLDQGAGWEGKLTIMDINSKEYWQSDKVSTLYPKVKGR